jgi:uncharacterized protein with HEPN domain
MQRDVLLLTEMIDAAEQAHQLVTGISVSQLGDDRQRRDALLWNFTVLGDSRGPSVRAEATRMADAARLVIRQGRNLKADGHFYEVNAA